MPSVPVSTFKPSLSFRSVDNSLSSLVTHFLVKIKICRTIILPVVLYGCEAWSLTLSQERRLKVFEIRILRRIFEPKRDTNGELRRLHNEDFIVCTVNLI